jgi:hypothetical protein
VLRDRLVDIPVLDHLVVMEPQDINVVATPRPWLSDDVNVQDHEVTVHERAFDLAVTVRKCRAHALDEFS